MSRYLGAYLVTLVLFAAIDTVWLAVVARRFYAAQLGPMLAPRPDLVAAALFYLIYSAGLVHFAVLPGLRAGAWSTALGQGALLGLVAYAAYDLSNLATLKDWPIPMTVVDLAWGTAVSGVVAAGACVLLGWLGRS